MRSGTQQLLKPMSQSNHKHAFSMLHYSNWEYTKRARHWFPTAKQTEAHASDAFLTRMLCHKSEGSLLCSKLHYKVRIKISWTVPKYRGKYTTTWTAIHTRYCGAHSSFKLCHPSNSYENSEPRPAIHVPVGLLTQRLHQYRPAGPLDHSSQIHHQKVV